MAKQIKRITLTLLAQERVWRDWYVDFKSEIFQKFLKQLVKDMKKIGIALEVVCRPDIVIEIKSYTDLLNAVKISSVEAGHLNLCVGHIMEHSEHLDLMEDIVAALKRVAFAPETIPPSNEFRKICHNCGCGC